MVLAGLFGMHGMADHSTGHTTAHQAMATAVHDVADAAPAGDVATPAPGALELCVAVLLGGLLLLLLLGRGERRTPWALPRAVTVAAPTPRGRDPDPPTPALLSVYRC
nr:DUF6153 family protein [Nocardioides ginsengisegetis]